MRLNALARLSSRFNDVPPSLAMPHDSLITLDENGRLFFAHPFEYDYLPLDVSIPGEKIIRIRA